MRSFANRRLVALALFSNLAGTALGAEVQAHAPAAAPQSDGKAREAWRAEMVRLPLLEERMLHDLVPEGRVARSRYARRRLSVTWV